MSRKQTSVQLHLSPEDQQALNYQNPILVWDFQELMRMPFSFEVSEEIRQEVIQAIKQDISIPPGYLNNYRVVYSQNVLLVIP